MELRQRQATQTPQSSKKNSEISSFRKNNSIISRPPYQFDLKETHPFISTMVLGWVKN